MGTHISKVKSVDLDVWTPEQMAVSILRTLIALNLLRTPFSRYRNGGIAWLICTGKRTSGLDTFPLISESVFCKHSHLAKSMRL